MFYYGLDLNMVCFSNFLPSSFYNQTQKLKSARVMMFISLAKLLKYKVVFRLLKALAVWLTRFDSNSNISQFCKFPFGVFTHETTMKQILTFKPYCMSYDFLQR